MKIHRIETGKVRIKENQLQRSDGIAPKMAKVLFGKNWSSWLPIYAWVIEHPEGIIVVDTGETHKTKSPGYLPKWHPYYAMAVDFDVKPEDEIGPKLKNMGIDPVKDVKKVIMTHLHTDHAGGMYHFPNSEIMINSNEYKLATGISGILSGYLPHRWPAWLNPNLIQLPNEPFYSFSQSAIVTNDKKIRIVGTPGHVAGHLSVIVESDDVYYFLAGDTSYTQDNLLQLMPDGIGTRQSIETLQNILSFAQENPTVYLPSHDPEVPARMDNIKIIPCYKPSLVRQ